MCGVSSALQLQHDSLCRFLGLSGECAQNSQTLHNTRQNTSTTTRITEGVKKKNQEALKHTQLSCRRQGSPTAMYYRSGERARITMRPQTKYARSQGTPSPQISVTFRHFSYEPIIWRRGPRPKAHWYMRTYVANPRILTTTPPFQ